MVVTPSVLMRGGCQYGYGRGRGRGYGSGHGQARGWFAALLERTCGDGS